MNYFQIRTNVYINLDRVFEITFSDEDETGYVEIRVTTDGIRSEYNAVDQATAEVLRKKIRGF